MPQDSPTYFVRPESIISEGYLTSTYIKVDDMMTPIPIHDTMTAPASVNRSPNRKLPFSIRDTNDAYRDYLKAMLHHPLEQRESKGDMRNGNATVPHPQHDSKTSRLRPAQHQGDGIRASCHSSQHGNKEHRPKGRFHHYLFPPGHQL
jgi:hypothetical protein